MRLVHAVTMTDINNTFNLDDRYSAYTQIATTPLFLSSQGQAGCAGRVSDGIRMFNYANIAIQGGPAARQLKSGEVVTFGHYYYPWLTSSPISSSSVAALLVGSVRGNVIVMSYAELFDATDSGRASYVEVSVNSAGTEVKVWVNGALRTTVAANVDMETLTFYWVSLPNNRYQVLGEFYMAIFDPAVELPYLGRWKCVDLKLDSSEFKNVTAYDGSVGIVGKVPKSTAFSYTGTNALLGATVLCAINTQFEYTLVAEVESGETSRVQESTKLPGRGPSAIPGPVAFTSFPVASVQFDNVSKQLNVKLSVKE